MSQNHVEFLAFEMGVTYDEILRKIKRNCIPLIQECIGIISEESEKIELNNFHDETRINIAENILAILMRDVENNPEKYSKLAYAQTA